MNSVVSDATAKEPYTVIFGKKTCLGLASSVPIEFLQKIGNGVYEEKLEEMVNQHAADQTDIPGHVKLTQTRLTSQDMSN